MKAARAFLVLALALVLSVGCATKAEVEEIVATSNAAMVDVPDLAQHGDTPNPARLKAAVARIEALINAHPDQTVLVNTLRVRQAMMLTVNRQFEAARIAWSQASPPPGQRDRALLERSDEIVWWFENATNFADADLPIGRAAIPRFDATCDALPERSDIRYYLETMRAMVALAVANDTSTLGGDQAIAEVEALMAGSLRRLAQRFDAADQNWVQTNWDQGAPSEIPIAQLRARVWLRSAMRAYFKAAKRKDMNPVWTPSWVADQAAATP